MKITKAEYIKSAVDKNQFPSSKPMYGLVGRSNVGKSSFINALLNRKKLAYTSSNPGKTITLNFYNINDEFYLVDVPGYGFANRTKDDRLRYGKMMENLIIGNPDLKQIIMILDIRIKPTEDDKLMYDWLVYQGIKPVLVATKIDKIGSTQVFKHLKEIRMGLNISSEEVIYPVSSQTRKGFEAIELLYDNQKIEE